MARRGCPICGKPPVAARRPFCSRRCADLDLQRWFGEAYRLPVEEDDEDGDGQPPDDADAPGDPRAG